MSDPLDCGGGPAAAAIVDGELATLGEPLLDLSRLVASGPDAIGQWAGTVHATPWAGFPDTGEPIAHSCRRSKRNLRHCRRNVALAGCKLSILCAGPAPANVGQRHRASPQRLIVTALARSESAENLA